MNKRQILLVALILNTLMLYSVDYDDYFTSDRIRMDYIISGSSNRVSISDVVFRNEIPWGGSKVNLIDTFNYGAFMLKVFDIESGKLIYSRGYSNLFQEWQATFEAQETVREFKECILFPSPKQDCRIELFRRDSNLLFQPLIELKLETNKILQTTNTVKEIPVHGNALPENALDIVFVSEGYTVSQEKEFIADVSRFKAELFKWLPYSEYMDKINIKAVFVPSNENGVDIPADSIWKDTPFDCGFSTFGITRYLSVPDLTKVYDKLNGVAFDQVCVLVNSNLYGGGGIFNFYNVFTSDNEKAGFLFVHEFGHGFAGLADEYFSNAGDFEDAVRKDFEPYEPNITTLVNFEEKWKALVADITPIPTSDSLKDQFAIGVFEGAAYSAKGIYRPAFDCAMRTSTYNEFCKVCQKSIEQMILFYSE